MRTRLHIATPMKLAVKTAMAAAALAAVSPAAAQEIGDATDTARYVFSSALLFAGAIGCLVFVFAFGLRDVGLARPQHTVSVCLRMMGLVAVTALAFWISGYNLMHLVEQGGLLGEFRIWRPLDDDPLAAGRPEGLHWLFNAGLAAIGAAIVSSAVSERVKLWPFIAFAAAYAGLIYPIIAGWVWGGGYLDVAWSFYDFGGAAVVHMTGGAAALAAAFVVGPRPGKFVAGGARQASSDALPLSAFGAGLIWASGLLILAAMVKSLATVEDAISIGRVAASALLAGAGAVLTALFLTQTVYKRVGLVTASCAAVGGLVAIAADPVHPAMWQAVM
ncbi:MAG: ammonium transporter family protein, partial [Hyphococcus sp.]